MRRQGFFKDYICFVIVVSFLVVYLIKQPDNTTCSLGFCQAFIRLSTDYGGLERKFPSVHGQKFNTNPNPKSLGTTEAYSVCHIGPIFQISIIYAFIGCRQSVRLSIESLDTVMRVAQSSCIQYVVVKVAQPCRLKGFSVLILPKNSSNFMGGFCRILHL